MRYNISLSLSELNYSSRLGSERKVSPVFSSTVPNTLKLDGAAGGCRGSHAGGVRGRHVSTWSFA